MKRRQGIAQRAGLPACAVLTCALLGGCAAPVYRPPAPRVPPPRPVACAAAACAVPGRAATPAAKHQAVANAPPPVRPVSLVPPRPAAPPHPAPAVAVAHPAVVSVAAVATARPAVVTAAAGVAARPAVVPAAAVIAARPAVVPAAAGVAARPAVVPAAAVIAARPAVVPAAAVIVARPAAVPAVAATAAPPRRPAAADAAGRRDLEAEAVRHAGGSCPVAIYRMAWAAAESLDIEPALVAAIIETESGCRMDAVSAAGARGLMQLIPAFGARDGYRLVYGVDREPTVDELASPDLNIRLGVAYLGVLRDRYGSLDPQAGLLLAVASYNCGPDFVAQRLPDASIRWGAAEAEAWIAGATPAETRLFVATVFGRAGLYHAAIAAVRARALRQGAAFN